MSQQDQSTHQAVVEALDQVREGHIAALNDGDVNAWVGAFTADGVQMPPNAPARQGEYPCLVASLLSSFLCRIRICGR